MKFSLSNSCSLGFVLGKKNLGKRKVSDMSEANSNCWETRARFDKLTYWNHDTYPSKDDAFIRSFHWFSVAKAVSFLFTQCFFFHVRMQNSIFFLCFFILEESYWILSAYIGHMLNFGCYFSLS